MLQKTRTQIVVGKPITKKLKNPVILRLGSRV